MNKAEYFNQKRISNQSNLSEALFEFALEIQSALEMSEEDISTARNDDPDVNEQYCSHLQCSSSEQYYSYAVQHSTIAHQCTTFIR